jgi:signal transduction histidine kinase
MKHSNGTEVSIDIRKSKLLEIIVKDNGIGFNVKKQDSAPGGSGLSSIKNRLSMYNGSFAINSSPEKGTEVQISLNAGLN